MVFCISQRHRLLFILQLNSIICTTWLCTDVIMSVIASAASISSCISLTDSYRVMLMSHWIPTKQSRHYMDGPRQNCNKRFLFRIIFYQVPQTPPKNPPKQTSGFLVCCYGHLKEMHWPKKPFVAILSHLGPDLGYNDCTKITKHPTLLESNTFLQLLKGKSYSLYIRLKLLCRVSMDPR